MQNIIKWTDTLIKEKLIEVMKALEIDRMPTRSECEAYYHNGALTNAVARRGGWYAWARKLNLGIKDSETTVGKSYEKAAEENLISLGYDVRRMPQNFPYDILVDDSIKIDVKASHLYNGPHGSFYTFNLDKQYATCDCYILYMLHDNNEIEGVMIVPSKFVIANNQISVGRDRSKYYRFKDRWDYIAQMVDLLESVV